MVDDKHSPSPPPYSVPRHLPRYRLDVRVRVSIPRHDRVLHGRTADIGERGLGFFAPAELQVGDTITVEFTLPYAREPQRCTAIVRNRNGYRYGVEFQGVNDATREVIARSCKALSLLV